MPNLSDAQRNLLAPAGADHPRQRVAADRVGDLDDEAWRRLIHGNLDTCFVTAREALPALIASPRRTRRELENCNVDLGRRSFYPTVPAGDAIRARSLPQTQPPHRRMRGR